jgi:hypothetical protein
MENLAAIRDLDAAIEKLCAIRRALSDEQKEKFVCTKVAADYLGLKADTAGKALSGMRAAGYLPRTEGSKQHPLWSMLDLTELKASLGKSKS